MTLLNKSQKNKTQKWFFWIGILVVLISHILMLTMGMPEKFIKVHAWANLVATLLIFVGAIR